MSGSTIPILFDRDCFRVVAHGDKKTLFNCTRAAVDDLPLLVENLQTAFARNDWEVLELMAQSIRGIASNFRAEPLTQLAATLEDDHAFLSELEIAGLVINVTMASNQTVDALENILHSHV